MEREEEEGDDMGWKGSLREGDGGNRGEKGRRWREGSKEGKDGTNGGGERENGGKRK